MLTRLTLENFRGFEHHELPLQPVTVIVGKNNAGKSTVVEALRLLSIVVSRYRNLGFHPGPSWTMAGRTNYGVRPSLRNMEITFQGMFHRYNEPPAVITANFAEGQSVTIYVAGEDRFHAVIRSAHGRVVNSRQKAIEANLPAVSIMPQVGPVQKREVILSEEYVRSAMFSSLAPMHFRNQLAVRYDLFHDFQRLVGESWPGVAVEELIKSGGNPGDELYLEIRNDDFVGEVALMGHGLQMWLQTIWFLILARDSQTVILDEPDVYMHPDLQRRLVRFLLRRSSQCIVTTHSVEILSEVRPEEVLVVDKRSGQSRFAVSIPAVQRLIEGVGSVHNIHLARLWHARRFILVEGKDLGLLKAFQNVLFPDSQHPIDSIPSMPVGGWGGWSYAVGSAMTLQNAVGEAIITYCVLDSDYHTAEEITERYKQAQERNVQLHIWSLKEIENFLFIPSVIQRVISNSLPKRATGPTEHEVNCKLLEIGESLRDEVLDCIAAEIHNRNRKLTISTANKLARERIESVREQNGHFLALISGKTAISRLSEWSQTEFGVQLNALRIGRAMHQEDVPGEIARIIGAIETQQPF